MGGEPLHFNWTIPADITAGSKCVLRARYNISTNDYDNWNTFYMEDEDGNSVYPISNDPNLNILKGTGYSAGVQLNVNTAQFGRTFQDRSHVFYVQDRPANIDPAAMIYNLNVRGRRGNIVEVYPSVEYDYIPRELYVTPADYVHIQWTGSLSSPDGAGQGAAETDKNNMVCIAKAGDSVPLMYSDPACTMFTSLDQHISTPPPATLEPPTLSTSSSTTSLLPSTTLPMPSSSSPEEEPLESTTSSTPGTTTLPTVPRRVPSTSSPALSLSTLFKVVVVVVE